MASKHIIDAINEWNEKHPDDARPAGLVIELDDDSNIKCPVCGESYGLHIKSIAWCLRDEDFAFVMRCENGCEWMLNLIDHEGYVYLNANGFEEVQR